MSVLMAILAGGDVTRYHQWVAVPRNQTVAEHTWRMSVMALTLYGSDCLGFLPALLLHDASESRIGGTGDLPAPVKWAMSPSEGSTLVNLEKVFKDENQIQPWFAPLTRKDRRRLKFMDSMEVLIYAVEQLTRGNSDFGVVGARIGARIQETGLCVDEREGVFLNSYLLALSLQWAKIEGDSDGVRKAIAAQARFDETMRTK